MRVRSGTPMRRGIGDSAFCAPTFVGPLSPEQQATCANEQLQNIKDFYYQAGQENAPQTGLPDPFSTFAIGPIPGYVTLLGGLLLLLKVIPKR